MAIVGIAAEGFCRNHQALTIGRGDTDRAMVFLGLHENIPENGGYKLACLLAFSDI
jgi:hypothetical protein